MLSIKISTSSSEPSKTKLDAVLIPVPLFSSVSPPWKAFGHVLSKICAEAAAVHKFYGKEGSVVIFPTLGKITPSFLALIGLGESTRNATQQRYFCKAIRQLHQYKIRSLGVVPSGKSIEIGVLAQALEEATYRFDTFSNGASKEIPEVISQLVIFAKAIPETDLRYAEHMARAVRYAREMANQPGNVSTPETLALEAQKLARRHRLGCEIWDVPRLKRDGFGGLLAVGQGSINPPRFIRLDYRGASRKEAPYIIVGKGLTFDSGGISIKESSGMETMKFDKCGGVAVLGVMEAISALRLPINITGLVSAAENLPSATAYRPGDLIKTLSGKYVEVINTDAEGRIVLADALTYAQSLKPRAMVDIATLTGACQICFGNECAALLSNHDPLLDKLRKASDQTGERVWPMPLWPEYQEKMKSDIAFMKNSAGRNGGTMTAACFLNAFVDARVPWAHVDIASVAWVDKGDACRPKGPTAFGVRLLTKWLELEAVAR